MNRTKYSNGGNEEYQNFPSKMARLINKKHLLMNYNFDQYLYVLQFSLILSTTLNNLKQPFDNCGVTLGQLSDNELWYHLGTTFGQFGTSFIHLFGKL